MYKTYSYSSISNNGIYLAEMKMGLRRPHVVVIASVLSRCDSWF